MQEAVEQMGKALDRSNRAAAKQQGVQAGGCSTLQTVPLPRKQLLEVRAALLLTVAPLALCNLQHMCALHSQHV